MFNRSSRIGLGREEETLCRGCPWIRPCLEEDARRKRNTSRRRLSRPTSRTMSGGVHEDTIDKQVEAERLCGSLVTPVWLSTGFELGIDRAPGPGKKLLLFPGTRGKVSELAGAHLGSKTIYLTMEYETIKP